MNLTILSVSSSPVLMFSNDSGITLSVYINMGSMGSMSSMGLEFCILESSLTFRIASLVYLNDKRPRRDLLYSK